MLALRTSAVLIICMGCAAAEAKSVRRGSTTSSDDVAPAALYHERFRPQFHFTPDKGWMNDPNGLVYLDGEVHWFFQHRPDALTQTPVMSWGHAVSSDLVHWTQLP